jgi:hypothetical protein
MKKHPINYICKMHTAMILVAVSALCASCKKDVVASLPGAQKSAALNFYIASDVMNAGYGPGRGTTAAYVDSIQNHGDILYNPDSRYPVFAFGFLANPEYPQVRDLSGINLFTYIRYNSGIHKLLFTDITNTIVADTTTNLEGSSWNSLYLADKPQANGTDAAYTILSVPEPRTAEEGKTGVRFIHLSPDAGALDCKALLPDGVTPANTLANVRFREASAYTWLTQEQAANGLLRLQIGSSHSQIITAIPAMPGRAFVVIIRGFINNTTRRLTTGKNADGSLIRETVNITPGLHADVRASY